MNPEILKQKKVKSITIRDTEYFSVLDIKENHPDLKVDIKEIVTVNETKLVQAQHVELLTEFDKTIKGIFKKK